MSSFTPQQIEEFLQEFFDVVGARQYVGARYVPIFGRAGEDSVEWDDTAPYEPLTVVMHEGVSYVSRQYVPTGVRITNTNYWVQTYRFNAQVEEYRQTVLNMQSQVDALSDLVESDYVPFPITTAKYGTVGQVLSTHADGSTEWINPVSPTDEQAAEYIGAWLDAHPEATTTVLDGSITDAKLAQTGGILSEVRDLERTGAGLGLGAISAYNLDCMDYVYQFVDNSTNVTGEIYNQVAGSDDVVVISAANFGRALPFTLGPGSYSSYLYGFFVNQSYVRDSQGVRKFADAFPTIGSAGTGTFVVTEPTTVYLSLTQSWKLCIIVNTNEIITTYTSDYIQRRFYYLRLKGVGVNASDIVGLPSYDLDTTALQQAFVKDGALTCNNDHPNVNTSIAKYTKVDMGSPISKVMCRAKFRTKTNNASITLISTARESYLKVQDITQASIHVGFSGANCTAEIYQANVRTALGTFAYDIAMNTEYEFGWSLTGTTLTVYLPDGTTQQVTNEALATLNGRYLVFEHFSYQTQITDPVTDEFGQPVITGIYCTCQSNPPLRDDFSARLDGLPYVAPTGQPYIQFRNASTGDTVYDSGAGTVN